MNEARETPLSVLKLLRDYQNDEPDAVCFYLTDKDSSASRTLTISDFTRAIDRLSWWILVTLKEHGKENVDKIAYIGPDDLRYILFPLAAVQISLLCATLSPRNSALGNESILDNTNTRFVMYGDDVGLDLLPSDQSIFKVSGPTMDGLCQSGLVDQCPEAPSANKPLVTGQTSASTGKNLRRLTIEESTPQPVERLTSIQALPKPVTISTDGFMTFTHKPGLPDFNGLSCHENITRTAVKHYLGWPICHFAGFCFSLWTVAVLRRAVIVPSPGVPKDGRLAIQISEKLGADGLYVTPGVIQELCELPGGLDAVRLLPRSAAAQIAKATSLIVLYGSSETVSSYALYQPHPDDWDYTVFPPDHNSIEWRPYGYVYELVVRRNEKLSHLLGVFKNFPALDEWATGDLFEPHPTKAHHWRCLGRQDDVIIFSNGSKLVPSAVELPVCASLLVKTAFITGHEKPFPILLVEPADQPQSESARAHLHEELWAHVQKCNDSAPGNGQIESKHHIVLVVDGEQLPASSKKIPARSAMLERHAAAIEEVYERFGHLARRDINQRLG